MSEELDGWLTIPLAGFNDGLFKDEPYSYRMAFLWVLLNVSHKETTQMIVGNPTPISIGEGFFKNQDIAKCLMWDVKKLVKFLEDMTEEGFISYEMDQIKTKIKVINIENIFMVSEDIVARKMPNIYGRIKNKISCARPAIPKSIVNEVYKRDGEICAYCHTTDGPFQLDHIVPWSRGGKHTLKNLTVACQPCNGSKGNKLLSEWGGRE